MPGGSGPSDVGFDSPVSDLVPLRGLDWLPAEPAYTISRPYKMAKQRIIKLIGSPPVVQRLREMGLYPGQIVQVIRDGVWKIDGRFTVGIRLTDAEIVLE